MYRPSGTDARSLLRDQAWIELSRYVATELLELGRYVATERNTRSVVAWRPFSSSCPMSRVSSAKLFVRKNLFRKINELLQKGHLREFLSEKAKNHLNKEVPAKSAGAIPA
ncbi:hypothetical protein F2Q70_00029485 [Brassica cretica]|uniref:Uncharacterized protein n=1 Tax=Brassica cretica TaxID=69181 RepID=A0A8S9FIT1_BRACR|nr:hypothetical protein F2Q70_00029485 [Brassica cretica]